MKPRMAVTVLAATLGACGSTDEAWIPERLWNGDVESLRMAADASHRLFLVWSSPVEGEQGGVWAAVAEPDGRWSAPARLSAKGREPRVGAGGGGAMGAMAVWWEPDAPRLRWSRWAPPGWTAAQPLPAGDGPSPAELAVEATGDAMAIWFDRPALRVATYRLDRGWEPPQVIASAADTTLVGPAAVARAGTEAATLWNATFVQVRVRTSVTSFRWIDGAWRSAFVGSSGPAAVTFDGSGTAVAASATVPSTVGVTDVLVRSFVGLPAGDWTEDTLSLKGLSRLALARSSAGEVALLYGDRSAAIELLYRPFDGRSFQAAERVHVAATAGVGAVGPIALGLSDGSAVAAWFEGGQVWAAVKTGATWAVAQPVLTSADDCGAETSGSLAAAATPSRMTVVWSDRGCGVPALWIAHRLRD